MPIPTTPTILTTHAKREFLGDYAVFARAAYMEFGSDAAAQTAILSKVSSSGKLGAVFGWSDGNNPGGGEHALVQAASQAGAIVHPADYNRNLEALSNLPLGPLTPVAAPDTCTCPSGAAKHTVAFVMTDGDNLQWTLGRWSMNPTKWFGATGRGDVPVGWTVPPALAWLAPTVFAKFQVSRAGVVGRTCGRACVCACVRVRVRSVRGE